MAWQYKKADVLLYMSMIELNVLLLKTNQLSLRIFFESVNVELNMRKMKHFIVSCMCKLQVPK